MVHGTSKTIWGHIPRIVFTLNPVEAEKLNVMPVYFRLKSDIQNVLKGRKYLEQGL